MTEERSVQWVCLDVGETLIEETRVWTAWADVMKLPPLTLFAALGAAIQRGEPHWTVLERFGGPEWFRLQPSVEARYGGFQERDLYPDALPTVRELRATGYHIGIVANQPAIRNSELKALGFDPELMAMSDEIGIFKPNPEFYAWIVKSTHARPAGIVYVGDRLDNDVLPALAAGLRPIWIRRGPWGRIPSLPAELVGRVPVIESLSDLPAMLLDLPPSDQLPSKTS